LKAVTLTQPWATLVAVGEKTIETRSWPTNHRGPLAIHAAKGLAFPVNDERTLATICESEPFASVLRPHLSGYTPEERASDLPRGEIVAVVTLELCLPTYDLERTLKTHGYNAPVVLSWQERTFGDFSPGRYAWVFGRRVHLNDPIECRGGRGLWDVPEDVRRELRSITDMAWTPDEEEAYKRKLADEEIETEKQR
jgi:hypothetical protein